MKGLDNVVARHAFGAVVAYWKTNLGSAWALKFWEDKLTSQAEDLHVQSVVELCEAFRYNRTHHRDHMRNMITQHFKKMIVEKWLDEVEYHQRCLFDLLRELEHLEYYDKDIWTLALTTIGRKKRINNITFFDYFNKIIHKLNTEPSSPFFKTLDSNLKSLKEKHYTQNR